MWAHLPYKEKGREQITSPEVSSRRREENFMKMELLKVWFILLQFHPSQKLPKGQDGCKQKQVLIGNVVRIALL